MITFNRLGKYGRLGNQLFQISAVISYSIDNNKEYALRPKYDGECWKELLEYDIDLDNYFDKII